MVNRNRFLYPPVPLTLAVLFSSLLIAAGCSKPVDVPDGRVFLIGFDGLDPILLEELIEEGRLPAFSSMMEEGVHGSLMAYEPILSPLIWTTIATGRPPDEHGILSFAAANADGEAIPVPSSRRQTAALWNIASGNGIGTTLVGWYATWPAETILGQVVSDRFVRSLYVESGSEEAGGLPQVAHPPDLTEEIEPFRRDVSEYECAQLMEFVNVSPLDCSETIDTPFNLHNRLHHLRLVLARNESYHGALLHLLKNRPTKLTLAYYDLTDTGAHLFMPMRPPQMGHIGEEDYIRFSDALNRIYEKADRMMAEILGRTNPGDTVIVVSDHGFKSGNARPLYSSHTEAGAAALWHRLEGTIIAKGGKVRPGRIEANVFDVAPTVLALLGLPASEEMPGRAIPEITGGAGPPRVADLDGDYAPPPLPDTAGGGDGELERLRALGYVAGGGGGSDETRGLAAVERFNLAMYYVHQNQSADALRELNNALAADPGFEKALAQKCRILIEGNRLREAFEIIPGLKTRLEEAIRPLRAQIAAAAANGNEEEAGELRDQLQERQRALSAVLHMEGEIAFKQRNLAAAAQSFKQAAAYDPDNVDTLYNLGVCQGMTGEYGESAKNLEAVLRKEPGHRKAMQSLAVAKIRLGLGGEARPYLESLLAETPGDANLAYLMGESHRADNDMEAAAAWYRKALETDPTLEKAQARLDALTAD